MGANSSHDPPDIEDDELGVQDRYTAGVTKRIPVEMKPRGKIGVCAGRSLSKHKPSNSLRSALSVEAADNLEVERVTKEFEMYRMKCDSDIANMRKKEQKLETENRKLRAELQALQKMCKKQRDERDAALDAEHRALMRAAAIEADRDKIQRQFKIFRETKESELQNLLRAKRSLEGKLAKLGSSVLEDSDNSSRVELGFNSVSDWWSTLDSEQSQSELVQMDTSRSTCRAPEFVHSLYDHDGPYVTVRKDDWQQATASLSHMLCTVPLSVPLSVIRVFIIVSNSQREESVLCEICRSKLQPVCYSVGLLLDVVHLPRQCNTNVDHELYSRARLWQMERSNILVVFADEEPNQNIEVDVDYYMTRCPTKRFAVVLTKDKLEQWSSDLVKKFDAASTSVKVVAGCQNEADAADSAANVISEFVLQELMPVSEDKNQSTRTLFGSVMRDIYQDSEQAEILDLARQSSCELGFEKYYEMLTAHISAAGPLPPLLVCGTRGSGKSLLLAKWIELQQSQSSGCLFLYHFVRVSSQSSADPTMMIRRLTVQLMQHVACPPMTTEDPERLTQEFPKWLEKVSSRLPGGIVLVIDAVDCCQDCERCLSWLVDPLPVDLHVIVSVSADTCPLAWKSWPSLVISELSSETVRQLVNSELAVRCASLPPELEDRVVASCQRSGCPRCVVVLTAFLAVPCWQSLSDKDVELLLQATSTTQLYRCIIEHILSAADVMFPSGSCIVRKVLMIISMTHNGVSEMELCDVIPELTETFSSLLCYILQSCLILTSVTGLHVFDNDQVHSAVSELLLFDSANVLADIHGPLLQYFASKQFPGSLLHRIADELPWLCRRHGDVALLESTVCDPCIVTCLYARGHCAELMSHWQFIGTERSIIGKRCLSVVREMEDAVNSKTGSSTLCDIANVYETLGRFLSDLNLLSEALVSHQRSLEVRETCLDPDDPCIARSLQLQADLHAQSGKLMTAEMLYRQSLDIYEASLGKTHPDVGRALYSLAVFYQKQGKHDLAEPLHKQAVCLRRKNSYHSKVKAASKPSSSLSCHLMQLNDVTVTGRDSVELARTLNDFGVLHYLQNNMSAAESFLKRSLAMRENLLDVNHLDVAQSHNNLAALYNDLGQYHQAMPLYERALDIRQKHYPVEHPCVASVLKNLGVLCKKLGQLDKSAAYYTSLVESREHSFGANHPSVATALVNLGVLYSQLGKLSMAEPLFEKALVIYEESLEPCHPTVSETLRNFALLKYEQGDYEMAAKLYKRSADVRDSDSSVAGK